MTRYSDSANLDRMLELTVAALLCYLIPAVFLDQLQHVAHFHASNSILAAIIAPMGIPGAGHLAIRGDDPFAGLGLTPLCVGKNYGSFNLAVWNGPVFLEQAFLFQLAD